MCISYFRKGVCVCLYLVSGLRSSVFFGNLYYKFKKDKNIVNDK